MMKNETAKTTYYHGTIQNCYKNDSKDQARRNCGAGGGRGQIFANLYFLWIEKK